MEVLEVLAQRRNLSETQALEAFRAMYSGSMPPSCVGAFLMGLKTKGETALEIACGVNAALEEARLVENLEGDRIDTCGTGGDNTCSFNCSTVVALYLAALGHKVVKHGNRAVSSTCGSADVIEALGLPLIVEPAAVAEELSKRNFVFLFAPNFHPAFKRIMPIRKELGASTLFNLMGPLLNPARPTHQILGVPLSRIAPLMAETLALTGLKKGAVVHGAGGFDEITPFGPADVVWVRDGWLRKDILDPEHYGFPRRQPVVRGLLAGKGADAMQDMVVLNLGVALHLLEEDLGLVRALDKARTAMAEGAAAKIFLDAAHA